VHILARDRPDVQAHVTAGTPLGLRDRAAGTARWTPHTRRSFVAPPNKTLLLLANGAAARWGYRRALRNGRADIVRHAESSLR